MFMILHWDCASTSTYWIDKTKPLFVSHTSPTMLIPPLPYILWVYVLLKPQTLILF